tara:strand:- start:501 stop:1676 length:1176 start_codon:yes stop_codon:yes gene_type:complete
MLTKNINFKNFSNKSHYFKIKNIFLKIKKSYLSDKEKLLNSFSKKYKYSFSKKIIKKYKKFNNFRLIGMGGSILGSEAIHDFLIHKIKKNFYFLNNLQNQIGKVSNEKKMVNIIISKSGNTLETISNSNILIKKNKKNIFITEKENNYLNIIAKKFESEIIEHRNFIGGRYSVLSEVGMLPAELMGLNPDKFKQLNYLIKNKSFINQLILNVEATLNYLKKGKFVSVILNYDQKSENLFKWYQQLIAESLGKKAKGILPIISTMPKDNHSLMQLYLDGPKKFFYTFFYVLDKTSNIINKKNLQKSHLFLKNKTLNDIIFSQKNATENVFKNRNIPYRSFEIINRSEQVLGEIFCFFILETILLGRALKVNPFDQPSVELIKKETKKILLKS